MSAEYVECCHVNRSAAKSAQRRPRESSQPHRSAAPDATAGGPGHLPPIGGSIGSTVPYAILWLFVITPSAPGAAPF